MNAFGIKGLLPAGLLCRRRLIFDVRLSVRSFVRSSVSFFGEFHRRRHAPATLFLSAYTQCQISSCQKSIRKKLSFCNKGTIDEKVFLKKVDKKITELDMDKLVIFSQTGLVYTVQNLMFSAV